MENKIIAQTRTWGIEPPFTYCLADITFYENKKVALVKVVGGISGEMMNKFKNGFYMETSDLPRYFELREDILDNLLYYQTESQPKVESEKFNKPINFIQKKPTDWEFCPIDEPIHIIGESQTQEPQDSECVIELDIITLVQQRVDCIKKSIDSLEYDDIDFVVGKGIDKELNPHFRLTATKGDGVGVSTELNLFDIKGAMGDLMIYLETH